MKYIGRPHGGEGRGPSDDDGLLASDILGGGLESLSPPALVSELSKGEQYSRPIQVSDVSAVFSLLGGISPSKENDPSASYPSGDFPAVFSGNCSQSVAHKGLSVHSSSSSSSPLQGDVVSDVSAVFSLHGDISSNEENDPSASYPAGDFPAVFFDNEELSVHSSSSSSPLPRCTRQQRAPPSDHGHGHQRVHPTHPRR